MAAFEPVLTRIVGLEDSHRLEVCEREGGYQALRKGLRDFSPSEITEEVKRSGLRGRGGAGFPAGVKWGFLPSMENNPGPRYLVCNADESEPGTFKDRVILRDNPHLLLEGCILSSYALQANHCFIYIRGEYPKEALILERAIAEAKDNNLLGENILGSGFSLEIVVHRGAGAYICGEETSLLESLEGKRGYPRIKPPFPAVVGLYGRPTVINNVETLACVPSIVERGGDWFASIGPEKNSGPKLYCVSGHVARPGTYEGPMGLPLKELIEDVCGGMREGSTLKAVIPGGSSTPILTAEEAMKANMDFDSLAALGSMLGSAAVIVMDETTDMVRVAANLMRFYHHESCGQCAPCREGTGWLEKICSRFEEGVGSSGDLELMEDIADNIAFKTVCPLGDAARMPLEALIAKFRDEFIARIGSRTAGCVS
ncbi:MAG: NADH-quinone oxidoreductase subunit NuoF [Candidatus Krumholzibacteria bacterium]|jgi:NADH-quinone oxidoreductase subunit F|nr:NADH-quinone oxidoreductase subunit NuoF [Candidatus Krumholzibacteria bacterium]MDP6668658.1 NADH-quinone oxidoreductase subunit NuoF [Candidatus Krumholzibacteria bacterium]MDP6796343.1 NADH-quinone oxidoreductase subunit NuoF [Candidatus Krumholzibacteria bacterium]MDP7021029.1 NADH-quinone oxidoreductase subunit NuoF [Candidatus Krumholzibacteria bacterium]